VAPMQLVELAFVLISSHIATAQDAGLMSVEIDSAGNAGIIRTAVPAPDPTSDLAPSLPDPMLQAKDQTLPEKSPLGAVVVMVNSDDDAEMGSLEDVLVPSLLTSLRFRTPVIILHHGPRGPADDATFKLRLNPSISGLSLVDVTLRVDHFARQDAQKHSEKYGHSISVLQQGKNWKMDQFWALHAHFLPELQKFHYAWRLSPNASFTGDVTTDLYEVMQKQQAALGYRLLRNQHHEACSGLHSATKEFFEENRVYTPKARDASAFFDMYEQAECPLWTSDFQIVDLDYLRRNEGYEDYVKYMADIGGFARYGWGVPSVQAVFLTTQEKPERVLCMTPWVPSYHGESDLSCGKGLGLVSLLQSTIQDKFSRAGALETWDLVNVTQALSDASRSNDNETAASIQSLKAYLHPDKHTEPLASSLLGPLRIIFIFFGVIILFGVYQASKKVSTWFSMRPAEV